MICGVIRNHRKISKFECRVVRHARTCNVICSGPNQGMNNINELYADLHKAYCFFVCFAKFQLLASLCNQTVAALQFLRGDVQSAHNYNQIGNVSKEWIMMCFSFRLSVRVIFGHIISQIIKLQKWRKSRRHLFTLFALFVIYW